MPPRYAYWTILIDGKATAFRAKESEELLPTLNQLRRKNDDVALRYFSRGKLWDSPEQAEWAAKNAGGFGEKRGADWRPGGTHKDPRARFDRKRKANNAAGPGSRDAGASDEPRRSATVPSMVIHARRARPRRFARDRKSDWAPKPDRPRENSRPPKSFTDREPRGRPPAKPLTTDRGEGRPLPKPRPEGDRPWSGKPREQDRRATAERGSPGRSSPVDAETTPRRRASVERETARAGSTPTAERGAPGRSSPVDAETTPRRRASVERETARAGSTPAAERGSPGRSSPVDAESRRGYAVREKSRTTRTEERTGRARIVPGTNDHPPTRRGAMKDAGPGVTDRGSGGHEARAAAQPAVTAAAKPFHGPKSNAGGWTGKPARKPWTPKPDQKRRDERTASAFDRQAAPRRLADATGSACGP